MTEAEKEALYRDGFVVLRDIVPLAQVDAARRVVNQGLGKLRAQAMRAAIAARVGDEVSDAAIEAITEATYDSMGAGNDRAVLDLAAPGTALMSTVTEVLGGPVREITGAQLASNFPTDPGDTVNESGYPDRDTPFHAWHGHLDGLWNGATPMHQELDRPMSDSEREAFHREPSRNGGVKTYPEQGTTITNFTALLGIPLSDQSAVGSGNLGLLKGAHHEIERFFQMQRDKGGPLGPDGPDWERIDTDAANGCGLRHYPEAVRAAFSADAAQTADGRRWPKPTFMQVGPGDAVLALHAVPHSATRVEGPDPRLMAYFRLTAASRTEECTRVYPDALCDVWLEWKGMQDTVARLRG